MKREIVYLGHDNTNDLLLRSDGVPIDITPVTRFTLRLGATTIDSAVDTDAFTWPVDRTWKKQAVKALVLQLGSLQLAAGEYLGRLVSYDPDNPNGLVWTEELPVTVVA
jgi:hypothetical protein